MPERSSSGTSDYLAAERTFLAWIRTGLALMGFGFVVARFGLFLEALQTGHLSSQVRAYGLSFWFGTGLIVLGVMVNLFSAWSHIRLVHELERGGPAVPRPSTLAVAVALILAVLGLAMAVYLIWVRDPVPAHLQTSEEKPYRRLLAVKMSGGRQPSGVLKLDAWMDDYAARPTTPRPAVPESRSR